MVKISEKYQIHNINLPLFYYRKHPVSLTTNSQKILKNRTKIFLRIIFLLER